MINEEWKRQLFSEEPPAGFEQRVLQKVQPELELRRRESRPPWLSAVSRLIGHLETRGLVAVAGRRYVVRRPEALAALAEGVDGVLLAAGDRR